MEAVVRIADECHLEFWSAEAYREELKSKESCFLISANGNEVFGFIVGRFHPSSTDGTLSKNAEAAEESEADIVNIGIKSKYRKAGIGRQMLETFLEKAKRQHIKKVWLEVRKSNSIALKFYLANGFVKTGERRNFYANPPEDAVIMCLKL